jgi:iron complex outermembrane receptor protein
MTNNFKLTMAIGLTILLPTAARPAQAAAGNAAGDVGQGAGQEAGATGGANQPGSSAVSLGDIIVTARRVSERLSTVPITASAFNDAALRNASISNPQALTQVVAGVYLSGSGSPQNTQYAIRGSATPIAGAGSPGVITYFADVPLNAYVSSTPQYDLNSIQILKGPQGTLFGRNSVGGALLIYPAKPTYQLGGYVQGTIGNYATRLVEGAINVPIVNERVALRVAGRIDRADGYAKNLGAGGDMGNQHDNNFRVSLLVDPTDWLTNTTIFDYAGQPKSKGRRAPAIAVRSGLPIPAVQALIAQQIARGPRITDTGPLASFSGWHSWGITNRTDITAGDVELTNIFGYRNVFDNGFNSLDGIPGAYFDSFQLTRREQYSNELQVRGSFFDKRLTWLVGGFYSDTPPVTKANQGSSTLLGVPKRPIGYNFYGEKSKALFINLNYQVIDGVRLNGGYRYTWDSFSSCGGGGENAPPVTAKASECLTRLTIPSFIKGSSKAPTWTVGVDWQASSNAFLYLTSRRGYRSAGVNGPRLGAGLAAYQFFSPEKTTDVEIGAKLNYQINDVKARLNVSAFRTKTKGVQIVGTQISTGTYQGANLACTPSNPAPFIDGDCDPTNDPAQTVMTINGGDRTVTGTEIEAVLSPVKGLTLSGAASFLRAKTDRYDIPVFLQAFFPVGEVPLVYTPKKTFTGSVSYNMPVGTKTELAFNAQYYHSGPVDFYGYVAKPYDVVNARLDLRNVAGAGVDIGLFVRNLFDKDYVSGSALLSTAAIPTNSVVFGMPRTYGLELRYSFGG